MNDNSERRYTTTLLEESDTFRDKLSLVLIIVTLAISLCALFYAYRSYVNAKEAAEYCQKVYYNSPYSDPVYQGNANRGGGRNIEDGYDIGLMQENIEKPNPPTMPPEIQNNTEKPNPPTMPPEIQNN